MHSLRLSTSTFKYYCSMLLIVYIVNCPCTQTHFNDNAVIAKTTHVQLITIRGALPSESIDSMGAEVGNAVVGAVGAPVVGTSVPFVGAPVGEFVSVVGAFVTDVGYAVGGLVCN
eukprot:1002523_1